MNYRTLILARTLCVVASVLVGRPSTAENAQTAPAASGLVDDNAAGWIWRGMDEIDDSQFSGGTAHAGDNAYCAYTFHGAGIEVVGMSGATVSVGNRSHKLGKAAISIDGKPVSTVNLYNASTNYGVSLVHVTGLSDGNHVLEITGASGWIVVDCAYVLGSNSQAPQSVPVSTPGALSDGNYRLHPKHAIDKCLDVATFATDGVIVGINHVDANRPQIWHVAPLGGGRFKISSLAATNLALTLVPPSAADGAPAAHLYGYIADPAQELSITSSGDGYFRISPSSNGDVVLDVFKLLTADGTQTITYKWWGADNQQWAFEPVK